MNKKLKYLFYTYITGMIVGWIAELLYSLIFRGKIVNPGILEGPFCSIYGTCFLLLLILPKFKNKFFLFLEILLVFASFEYLISFISDDIFGNKIWDYSNYFLNINGRICLLFSLCWGIFGYLYINYAEPYLNFIFQKYNNKKIEKFYLALGICYIFDIVLYLYLKIYN